MLLNILINIVITELNISEDQAQEKLIQLFDIVGINKFKKGSLLNKGLGEEEIRIILIKGISQGLILKSFSYKCLLLDFYGETVITNDRCEACGKFLELGKMDGDHEEEEIYELADNYVQGIKVVREDLLFKYLKKETYPNFKLLRQSKINIVPFLGAGVATPFKLPDWSQLFNYLLDYIVEDEKERFQEYVKRGDFFTAIDFLKKYSVSVTTDDQVKRVISQHLMKDIDYSIDEEKHIYKDLKYLNSRFYLTTNYETTFSKYLNKSSICLNELESFHTLYNDTTNENKVLHVHGLWNRPTTMIVTKHDYEALYSKTDFVNKFATLMGSNSLLFIGFSFRDQFFMDLYSELLKILGGNHYIIVANPHMHDIQEFNNRDLRVIGLNVKIKDGALDNDSFVKSLRYIFSQL